MAGLSAAECAAIVKQLPHVSAAHMDYAVALAADTNGNSAERHIAIASDLGYPLPGLIENMRAGIAARRNNAADVLRHLIAARAAGTHAVVERNITRIQQWIRNGGPRQGALPQLELSVQFEVSRPRCQPLTPGPIAIEGHEPLRAYY